MRCFLRRLFFLGDFRPKLDSPAHNAEALDGWVAWKLFEICAREGLANVRCKRAQFLDFGLSIEVEVVNSIILVKTVN